MNVTLSNEQIEKAVQAAIFESITQDQRDLLIKGALQHLLTEQSNAYSGRRSPLQEAFNSAVHTHARKAVEESLADNADFKAALDKMIAEAMAKFMAADKAVVTDTMARALADVFTRSR